MAIWDASCCSLIRHALLGVIVRRAQFKKSNICGYTSIFFWQFYKWISCCGFRLLASMDCVVLLISYRSIFCPWRVDPCEKEGKNENCRIIFPWSCTHLTWTWITYISLEQMMHAVKSPLAQCGNNIRPVWLQGQYILYSSSIYYTVWFSVMFLLDQL